MNILLWTWSGAITLVFLVWMARHRQIGKIGQLLPPVHSRMYPGAEAPLPPLSMLVAAKDEESNIEGCLKSILKQDYPHLEVIAIDDRSTDRTGEMIDKLAALDARLTALHVESLHPGWFGKSNAMREGVARATAPWLCFTDADCVFTSARALSTAMRYALEREVDFFSLLPAQETNSFWERVIQPACGGILLIWFNPMKVNDPGRRTAYANGAFMLIRRDCYDAIGGHESVRTEINEDMHLARRAKHAGWRLAVASNLDLYSVRMYDSLNQIWSGWTRIFYGCFGSFVRILLSMLTVMVFSLVPWLTLGVAGVPALGADASPLWRLLMGLAGCACLAQLTVMYRFYALNRSHPAYALLYPVGAAFGLAALINAMRLLGGRRSCTWRGTTYRGRQVEPASRPA